MYKYINVYRHDTDRQTDAYICLQHLDVCNTYTIYIYNIHTYIYIYIYIYILPEPSTSVIIFNNSCWLGSRPKAFITRPKWTVLTTPILRRENIRGTLLYIEQPSWSYRNRIYLQLERLAL